MSAAHGRESAPDLTHALADALASLAGELRRLPGRGEVAGLHEVKELAPALETELAAYGARHNARMPVRGWTRPRTEVDLVVPGERDSAPLLVAELKVWNIGHQLFDLAKVCCLLNSGARSGFLVCVARYGRDFARAPGGELFPGRAGQTHDETFASLMTRHRAEWRRHVGRGGPEPLSVPVHVRTSAIVDPLPVVAYPGHELRAVQVLIVDPTPLRLVGGDLPERLGQER